MVSLAGLDPHRFLTSDDPLEVYLMLKIAERRLELDGRARQDQAIRIANAVSEMMNG